MSDIKTWEKIKVKTMWNGEKIAYEEAHDGEFVLKSELDAVLEKLDIDKLVNKFLAWPLPASVSSDPCVTDNMFQNRIGTNLLTADEARQMFVHVLDLDKK
jgi:hypothetical protein